MATQSNSSLFLFSIYLLFQFISVNCSPPSAPAIYVYGDSLSDSGNNNNLQTQARANYNPYGIDFPLGATGRFTNGKTIVDFIAQSLGLPFVPAYLGLSPDDRRRITTGVNYASGAAGILRESGSALGQNIPLEDQVKFFQHTVTRDLPNNFKTSAELCEYLAKSIFMVNIGSNDYINNYLQPTVYNSSRIYTPQQYADILASSLKKQLTNLYKLGARKLVVWGLGPIGCIPAIVNSVNPRPITPCIESVNQLVILYNLRLSTVILELSFTLRDLTFVYGDIFAMSYVTNLNPAAFGFSGGRTTCCVVATNGQCLPNQVPCPDRNQNIYWDGFHTTEAANSRLATGCYTALSPCHPNIQQLVLRR